MRLAEATLVTRLDRNIEHEWTFEAVWSWRERRLEGFVRWRTAVSERALLAQSARRIDILKTVERQVVTHRAMDSYASRIERLPFRGELVDWTSATFLPTRCNCPPNTNRIWLQPIPHRRYLRKDVHFPRQRIDHQKYVFARRNDRARILSETENQNILRFR